MIQKQKKSKTDYFGFKKNQYSLILIQDCKDMKVDGSKIIFWGGTAAAVVTAVVALYFSIR